MASRAFVLSYSGNTWLKTLVTVELRSAEAGTPLRLTHARVPDETSRKRHPDAWPEVLDISMRNLLLAGRFSYESHVFFFYSNDSSIDAQPVLGMLLGVVQQ